MAATAPDISGMPDPVSLGLKPDISGMPDPVSLGLKSAPNPSDFTDNESPEEADVKAETGAAEAAAALGTGAAAAVPAWTRYVAGSAYHGLKALIGYSVTGGDQQAAQRITDRLAQEHEGDRQAYDDIINFWSYHPRTQQGQAVMGLPGEAASAAAHAALPENVAESALQVGGDVLRAVPPFSPRAVTGLPARVGAARAAATAEEAAAGPATATPKKVPSAAVTVDQLRAQPNPIPPPNVDAPTAKSTLAVQKPRISPKAGESAQAAAQRQGLLPAAPQEPAGATIQSQAATPAAATEPSAPLEVLGGSQGGARLFHPPQEDGPQYSTRVTEPEQAARRGTLDELNRLGGGVMQSDRRGAVTGDWNETGNEFQTTKIPDAPGQLIRDQIASEHQALHNATQGASDSVGSEARNDIDKDTLEQRGGVVRGAIHSIEDHFNGAANGMYQTARAVLGDRPMQAMPRVQQILSDASHDTNPTAAALRRAAQTKLQQLWTVGDTRGNVRTAPGTVGAAERFHEFLNDSYHNDSASLIRKLKNATDMDVAERAGGNDMFQAARNVIQHRETMLEPDGVNELRRPKDRNKIDNEVPLDGVMDHVVGQDSEHFQHFMNVLRAGARLSPEIAEKSAAAIREIQGHMIAKLHTAARGDAGVWNAGNFYKAANRFSTNMPSAFKENPEVLGNLQTINRAGNILKMDKSYPGAVAQAAKVGLLPSLASKAIKGAKGLGEIGGVVHGNVMMAAAAHLGGKALERGVEGLTARGRLATAQESLIPRGGRQRGSVPVLREGERPSTEPDRFPTQYRPPQETPLDQLPHGAMWVGHDAGRPMMMSGPMKGQRGSVPILNVGHNVGDPANGGRVLGKTDIARAIAKVGGKIQSHDVLQPGEGASPNLFEPTSVVGLKKPLSQAQGVALARQLGQKAVAQNTGPGEGSMFIPKEHAAEATKEGWDKYNPDYFHMADGRNESTHLADFNPAELEGAPHPQATVKNAQRSAYPGIYDPPAEIMGRVKTAPEDPIMKDLFGVTRKDLHDVALSRGDVAPKAIPGVTETARSKGSAAAKNVMTPENAERIKGTVAAFKEHDPSAYQGMVGWYVMDPLHRAVQKVLGKGKAADAAYSRLNTLMGMASPGSDVVSEINRGTAAHMMASQGKFGAFERYGGNPNTRGAIKNAPELSDVKGHPYHSTSQAGPMRRYVDTGVGAQAPKTSMYIAASERGKSPEFQNKVLVGDSHFSRGVGLSDVRTAQHFSSSVSGPELRDLHPWYHENVAKPSGLPSTSAQAVQWGALSKETGVETPVGAPKLELFAQQVQKAAARLGVTPQVALTRIIKGIAHAG